MMSLGNDTIYSSLWQDHNYGLPASPTVVKRRLSDALASRVESLERKGRNSLIRERRAKKTVLALLEDLREKNLIHEEQKDKLDFYSGKINVHTRASILQGLTI